MELKETEYEPDEKSSGKDKENHFGSLTEISSFKKSPEAK